MNSKIIINRVLTPVGFGVFDQEIPICTANCNSPAGPWTTSGAFQIPSIAPGGTYEAVYTFKAGNGKEIACFKSAMNL